MSSTEFTTDLQDMKFVLFEQLNIDEEFAKQARFEDFDQETYEATIDEGARVAVEVLHPINGPGDRQGCTVDAGGATSRRRTASPTPGRPSPRAAGWAPPPTPRSEASACPTRSAWP